ERDDLGVEDDIAAGSSLSHGLPEQIAEPFVGHEDRHAGGVEESFERFARLPGSVRRVEQARMGDHTQELTQAEDRDRPPGGALRQSRQPLTGPAVFRQLFTVGVDENVRVDRDQARPSMRSYSESRSARSTPATRRPFLVSNFSRKRLPVVRAGARY